MKNSQYYFYVLITLIFVLQQTSYSQSLDYPQNSNDKEQLQREIDSLKNQIENIKIKTDSFETILSDQTEIFSTIVASIIFVLGLFSYGLVSHKINSLQRIIDILKRDIRKKEKEFGDEFTKRDLILQESIKTVMKMSGKLSALIAYEASKENRPTQCIMYQVISSYYYMKANEFDSALINIENILKFTAEYNRSLARDPELDPRFREFKKFLNELCKSDSENLARRSRTLRLVLDEDN